MLFNNQKASGSRKATGRARIHSIAGLVKGRGVAGSFEAAGSKYKFIYSPTRADMVGQKLQLSGRLAVTDLRGKTREIDGVRATLIATQGGVGAAPIRRQLMVGGVADSTASSSSQQQQQAGGAAGNDPRRPDDSKTKGLPEIDSTGPLSFCGVMYFRFAPLDPSALGVAADLSAVQLNARLAPTDDAGRDLQGLYSMIVDALYGQEKDDRMAAAAVGELNKLFAAK